MKRTAIALITLVLALGLTACETSNGECGHGNPAQDFHAGCEK